MNVKRRYKFKPDTWVMGLYKGSKILGRTYTSNGQNYAIVITEHVGGFRVKFDDLTNLKTLELPNYIPPITSAVQNKKRLTIIEKLILESIISINK